MDFSGRHYLLDIDFESLDAVKKLLGDWTGVWASASTTSANFPDQIGESWTGKTATAVKREMTGLAEVMHRASAKIGDAQRAVLSFQDLAISVRDQVHLLNNRWDYAEDRYLRNRSSDTSWAYSGLTNSGQGPQVHAGRTSWDQLNQDWAREQRGFDEEFADLRGQLVAGARKLAQALDAAKIVHPNPGVGDATGSTVYRELGANLPLTALRDQQGWSLFLSRDQATATANAIAEKRLRGEELNAADFAMLKKAKNHPWFSVAYITKLGPRGLLQGPISASGGIYRKASTGQFTQAEQAALIAEQEQLIDIEAALLTTASQQPDFPPEFARALAELTRPDNPERLYYPTPISGAGPLYGYALSVYLHRGGKFGEPFNSELSERIYAIHRDRAQGWPMPLPQDKSAPLTWSPLFGQTTWVDPLTGVLAMQARDPAAAQDFLLGNDGGKTRAERLMHRDWPLDSGSDNGESLGLALEAGSTKLRDHESEGSPGWKSAKLAGIILSEAPRTGGRERSQEITVPPAMQDSFGRVIAAYYQDFAYTNPNYEGKTGEVRSRDYTLATPEQAYGIYVNRDDLPIYLAAVVKNPAAVSAMLNAGEQYLIRDLSYSHHQLKAARGEQQLEQAQASYSDRIGIHANMMGLIQKKINDNLAKGGQDSDQAVKQRLDLAVIGIKTTLSIVPGGALWAGAFEAGVASSNEVLEDKILTDREGLSRQGDFGRGIDMQNRVTKIIVMQGFADGVYQKGLLGYRKENIATTGGSDSFLDSNYQWRPEAGDYKNPAFDNYSSFVSYQMQNELREVEKVRIKQEGEDA